MRGWVKALLILEVLIGFGPLAILLILGCVMIPLQVAALAEEPMEWYGPATFLLSVPLGTIGLCSLLFVISVLLQGREKIEHPVTVMAGVVAGATPLVPLVGTILLSIIADPSETSAFFGLLLYGAPLLATAHILYLSYPMFAAGFRQAPRPLLGQRAWLAIGIAAAALLIAFVDWRGLSEDELAARRENWERGRPAGYLYEIHFRGWIRPHDLLVSRTISVLGDQVIAAAYPFQPSPDDPRNYPPPAATTVTMDGVFEKLIEAKKSGARVRARFDKEFGFVERVYVESNNGWDLKVTNFRTQDAESALRTLPKYSPAEK